MSKCKGLTSNKCAKQKVCTFTRQTKKRRSHCRKTYRKRKHYRTSTSTLNTTLTVQHNRKQYRKQKQTHFEPESRTRRAIIEQYKKPSSTTTQKTKEYLSF